MDLPHTMRAVEIAKPGGPEVLRAVERPVPVPGAGQVVVRVAYAGVNRPDALQRAGAYDPPPGASDLPGLEGAGTIAAVGAGVARWKVGDRVCALFPGGSYAEHAATDAGQVLPVPDGNEPARGPRVCPKPVSLSGPMSSCGAVCRRASGSWCMAGRPASARRRFSLPMLLARGFLPLRGSAQKCDACTRLGAERAINYRDEDFVSVLKGEGGANLILDMVGGDYLPRNLKALAEDGRLVQIAFLQGPKVAVNFAPPDGAALDHYRVYTAPAIGCGQGGDCSRSGSQGLAVDRRRAAGPGHGQ